VLLTCGARGRPRRSAPADPTKVSGDITVLTHKTDLAADGTLDRYAAEFNKIYPKVHVKFEAISAYEDDVTDYTRAYAKSGGSDFQAFQADLAKLASEHGISNWTENRGTYTAIGAGLREAGVTDAGLLAYQQNIAGNDPTKAAAMQDGYNSAR